MRLSNKEITRLIYNYGEWAIITGATSGIGLELAKLLAHSGFNLIINSRNAEHLNELKALLELKSQKLVKIVAADLTTKEGADQIIESSKGLNIGLLIAAAGFGTSGRLIENSLESELEMVHLNCSSVLRLSHHFAQEFKEKKRGGIIFFSSIVAFQGTPYAANYAATKAYVQTLAEGLKVELKPFGVSVLSAAPGPVKSGFGNRAKMKMSMAMTPEQVGIPILKSLGRKTTVYPGYLSKLLAYSLKTVPRWAKVIIMGKIMGDMSSVHLK